MPITVAIVEDNSGLAQELQHLIGAAPDLTCVCACRNAQSALALLPQHAPDVVIMDIQLPGASGIECTAQLRRVLPATQFLIYSIHDEENQIISALAAGAAGYLLKDSTAAEILAAVREVCRRGAPMTREVARKVIEHFQRRPALKAAPVALTAREREVLELLATGCIDKEIADRLGISVQTVNSHLKHIYGKMNVHTRTEAVLNFLG